MCIVVIQLLLGYENINRIANVIGNFSEHFPGTGTNKITSNDCQSLLSDLDVPYDIGAYNHTTKIIYFIRVRRE